MPTKVRLVKAMVFRVVMSGCQSLTIKKAEHRRIDTFELWYWRRLLRVPWTAKRSSHSILKEISPEYSLEGLMLKLKLQYFGHLIQRTDSFEKTLMQGKIEGGRRGWQRMRWLGGITTSQWTWVWVNSGSWWWTGRPGVLQSMGLKESDTTKGLNWTVITGNQPELYEWYTGGHEKSCFMHLESQCFYSKSYEKSSYKEVIKDYAAKNVGKMLQR